MSRIFRYEVPVDDQPHQIDLWGRPLAVGCRTYDVVEFWALAPPPGAETVVRTFLVVGTGHQIDGQFRHWGTAVAPGGQLVWHLLELEVAAMTSPTPALTVPPAGS